MQMWLFFPGAVFSAEQSWSLLDFQHKIIEKKKHHFAFTVQLISELCCDYVSLVAM